MAVARGIGEAFLRHAVERGLYSVESLITWPVAARTGVFRPRDLDAYGEAEPLTRIFREPAQRSRQSQVVEQGWPELAREALHLDESALRQRPQLLHLAAGIACRGAGQRSDQAVDDLGVERQRREALAGLVLELEGDAAPLILLCLEYAHGRLE